MRTTTDYTKQRNRCSRCGHRVVMHTEGCNVKTRDYADPEKEVACECKRRRIA